MNFAVQLYPPSNGDRQFTAEVLRGGKQVFRDKLDPDSEFQRGKFLDGLAAQVPLDDGTRRDLNSQLMYAKPIGEATSDSTWQPMVKRMNDISLATTRWLRDSWYPLGAYTDISGDPGTGKSQLECELTAEVTNSGGDVLILSAEDSAETTLKPRLLAVGADCEAVHVLSFVRAGDDGEPVPINLVDHIDAFREAVEAVRPRLVWVDTIDAHAAGVNLNANTECRRYMRPLVNLAELHQFALVGIRHWNKKSGQSALYKGSGSVAIVAAARSAIVVAPHPSEPDCYVQASAKLNIAKKPTSRAYRIESATVYDDNGNAIPTSKIVWAGNVDIQADELSDQRRESGGSAKVDDCVDLISTLLATGSMAATDLETKCKAAGFSKATYRRACDELELHRKKSGYQGAWMVSLKGAHDFQWSKDAHENDP